MRLLAIIAGILFLVAGRYVAFPDAGRLWTSESEKAILATERDIAVLEAERGAGPPHPDEGKFRLVFVSDADARRALGFGIALAAGAFVCFAVAARGKPRVA